MRASSGFLSGDQLGAPRLRVPALALALAACTTEFPIAFAPIEYGSAVPLSVHVQLVLTQEFRQTQATRAQIDTTARIWLGDALAEHSQALARALFSDLTLLSDVPKPGGTLPVLIPAIEINTFFPTFYWESQETSAVIDWALLDGNGEVIWEDSVAVTERGPAGRSWERGRMTEAHFQRLLQRLFSTSFDLMSRAPEIRALAVAPATR